MSSTKSLGVMVDDYLNRDDQFKIVKSKLCGGLASLKKLKNILPHSKLGSVYFPIVESHIHSDKIWAVFQQEKLKLSKDCRIEPS